MSLFRPSTELSPTEKAISFIRQYWAELSILYLHEDASFAAPLRYQHQDADWTCFYAGPFMTEVFAEDGWSQDRRQLPPIQGVDEFVEMFTPGHVYLADYDPDRELDVGWAHLFSLVYLDDGQIMYSDYFWEADRGVNCFRITRMTYAEAIDLVRTLIEGNCSKARAFHNGGTGWSCDVPGTLSIQVDRAKPEITIDDVLQVCWSSLKYHAPESTSFREATMEVFNPDLYSQDMFNSMFTYDPMDVVQNGKLYRELARRVTALAGMGDTRDQLWRD